MKFLIIIVSKDVKLKARFEMMVV